MYKLVFIFIIYNIYYIVFTCLSCYPVLASVVVSENNETRFIYNYGTLVFSYILLTKLFTV